MAVGAGPEQQPSEPLPGEQASWGQVEGRAAWERVRGLRPPTSRAQDGSPERGDVGAGDQTQTVRLPCERSNPQT